MKNNHYHRFNGQNAIIAIMALENNQENSVIFNATSIENVLFTNMKYCYQYISYIIKD
jgi:DNA-directed RNA polymerase beta subunit